MRLVPSFIAVLLLVGCASSPATHYYTLEVAPSPSRHSHGVSTPVSISAVNLPPTLDRRDMVTRTGSNTMEIRRQDQWSAPLGPMIRRVLSQDLAARLPKDMVVMPGAPEPADTARIVVTIAQFGPQPDGKALLVAGWTLLRGDTVKPSLRRNVRLETDQVGNGADAQAAAMGNLLSRFAQHIALVLAGRK